MILRPAVKLTVHVEVTQAHIDAGVRMDCQHCPASLAVLDALRRDEVALIEPEAVNVHNLYALIVTRQYGPMLANVPGVLNDFIDQFDDDECDAPGPIEFDLQFVEWKG